MAKAFDATTSWVDRIFSYQTINHISDNLYVYVPLVVAAANTVDCFLVSTENKALEDEKKEKKIQLELTSRVISLILVDVPLLCLGSLVTFYRGQSQNILNTMLNTQDATLIETLSKELAVVSGHLGTSRDLLKGVVLASGATNLWFTLTNWFKSRNSWFRVNLRKLTVVGNCLLFFVLSKPVDVQIR